MTKDINIRLCELCGIKPRYGIYVDYGDLDHNYKLETNERKYRLIADYRWHYGVEDEDLKDLKPEFYPDFTKPENFVRLFNLPIVNNGSRTVGYFVVYEFTMKTIKEFIECLIIKLERTQFSITKEVKQSIREAEWVYV